MVGGSLKTMMRINPGDVYWLCLIGDIPHPHVVVSGRELSPLDEDTVLVCPLTTNRRKINIPGNVLLQSGEGNLEKQSIVEVAKVLIVNQSQLLKYVGTLSESRVAEILHGIRFLQNSFFKNR